MLCVTYRVIPPDTDVSVKTYNNAGLASNAADARSKIVSYAYDTLNWVKTMIYSDQTISLTYDSGTYAKGCLTKMAYNTGTTSWTYDAFGRVVSKNQIITNTPINSSLTLGYTYVNGSSAAGEYGILNNQKLCFGWVDETVESCEKFICE